MPVLPACAHFIPGSFVDAKRRNDRKVELEQPLDHFVPSGAARLSGLQPEAPRFGKPVLLVLIVVPRRVVLHRSIIEQRCPLTRMWIDDGFGH